MIISDQTKVSDLKIGCVKIPLYPDSMKHRHLANDIFICLYVCQTNYILSFVHYCNLSDKNAWMIYNRKKSVYLMIMLVYSVYPIINFSYFDLANNVFCKKMISNQKTYILTYIQTEGNCKYLLESVLTM